MKTSRIAAWLAAVSLGMPLAGVLPAGRAAAAPLHGPAKLSLAGQQQRLSQPLVPTPLSVADRAASRFFPSQWIQVEANQQHDPVFVTRPGAPGFLTRGTFWGTPLTGNEFWRLARAFSRYPDAQAWGAEVAQWLGNVMGVSVVDGIVYVEESRSEIFALDAATGLPLWHTSTVNCLMGDPLVANVGGKPMVFVAAGDVAFTRQHAVDYANQGHPPGPTVRGADFSAVYALNGLTGKVVWRFDTKGEDMPTPVLKNGDLFFSTGDGHLYAVNAETGREVSAFSNPGFSSMSSSNWYETANHQLYIIYGTQDPNYLMAVNETDPAHPVLAWEYHVPHSFNTGNGDVPPAVDPKRNLVITDSLINQAPPGAKPELNLDVVAVNATTGQLVWSRLAGTGPIFPVAFKGSVPMIHGGNVYVGDLMNQTLQSYNETTGARNWSTSLAQAGNPFLNEPRGGAVYYDHHILEASGPFIFTLDPRTGAIVNKFRTPGAYVWGITSPVIVGGEMYLGSISGWALALPARYVMTRAGFTGEPYGPRAFHPALRVRPPSYFNPAALPTPAQAAAFPSTWTAYAGNAEHDAVVNRGPSGVAWQAALPGALPLNAPPRDSSVFGVPTATTMTELAFGAGSGVSPANGILYVGGEDHTVNAYNAITGQLIWRSPTINGNFGQPLVTPQAVVVSSGDPWFNFGGVVKFAAGDQTVHLGASFQNLHGYDPRTGELKWTFYTEGTDMMTPVYYNGNLYWVNGHGDVWALSASTGKPVKAFLNHDGNPKLHLPGYVAIASPNVYLQGGSPILVVGTANPGRFYGINLATDSVAWSTTVTTAPLYYTGFGDVSPAVDPRRHLLVGDVLTNPGSGNTATLEAFALDPATGRVLWTRDLGTGPVPYGFTGAVPVIHRGTVYLSDPISGSEVALSAASGAVRWQAPLAGAGDTPPVVADGAVIQPAGSALVVFNAANGALRHVLPVGGAVVDNGAVLAGQTLYLGNAWGWVMALPLSSVLGTAAR
ncbi:MAG: PQQ-binding-like beta-propeller repeat protein [Firmicutes bacterium]|nr:PQQ-binding-like beta-propeller repeat protein [Bacillota bacterium]